MGRALGIDQGPDHTTRSERQVVVGMGRRRRSRPQHSVDDDDQLVDLPKGWYVDADEDGYGVEPQVGYCEGEPGYA
ncbi:MAG: hypothetical protein ABMA64_43610, partial [Myxococcota bacterium]